MARCTFRVALFSFALLIVAWAEDRLLLTEEDERRWNTPPELIPEQATKVSETKNGRSLLIPIAANININNGNAAALGYEIGPEDVNFASIAAELAGIALSDVSSQTNLGSTNLHIGNANSAAISSSQGTSIRFPGPVWTNIRPNYNNGYHSSRMPKLDIEVKPNHQQNRRPIMLHISSHETRFENRQPKIQIHKWRPNQAGFYEDEQR